MTAIDVCGKRFGCAICDRVIDVKSKLMMVDGETGSILCTVQCVVRYNAVIRESKQAQKH